MIKLSPSILAADYAVLGEEIKTVVAAGAEYIHLDCMDGDFVPSMSIGMPVIKSIRKVTDAVFDVHLMVTEPIRYVEAYKEAGADIITIHVEACNNVEATLDKIKELGCKAGISLNPATPAKDIEPYLDKVDMVLVMSVNPGFGGQKYISSVTPKIAEISKLVSERGLNLEISVDGGITLDNVSEVINAGANVVVAGSSVFNGDKVSNVKNFIQIFRKYDEGKENN